MCIKQSKNLFAQNLSKRITYQNARVFWLFWNVNIFGLVFSHPTLLQAEEKRACNPVPKCPSKLLEPAIGRSAGWSSLQGHFGTELRARFFCRMEYRWPWVGLGYIYEILKCSPPAMLSYRSGIPTSKCKFGYYQIHPYFTTYYLFIFDTVWIFHGERAAQQATMTFLTTYSAHNLPTWYK